VGLWGVASEHPLLASTFKKKNGTFEENFDVFGQNITF
jgi:hypothetical protein